MRADAVFEGGGVKAIGLLGALSVAEARGYEWGNLAGTSAGAIVAALLAAGYRADEISSMLMNQDLTRFRDQCLLGRIPVAGPILSVLLWYGIHPGTYFEEWMREKLLARGVRTFGDLIFDEFSTDNRYRFRLRVIASDLSNRRLLVLPDDVEYYGVKPEALDVAWAVRMSMSIPFFYHSVRLHYRLAGGRPAVSHIVDGGLLSNFPVWLFDSPGPPPWPTFGFLLVEPNFHRYRELINPLSFAAALFSTMMEAHDTRYMEEEDRVRTIAIPTLGIKSTDFNLSRADKERLFDSGVKAAEEFFSSWDFQEYVHLYRRGPAE